MKIEDLAFFVGVVDTEPMSISEAASRRSASQGGRSDVIRRLERDVGGKLFERSHHGLALTPLGAALLPDAREIVARHERMIMRAREFARRSSSKQVEPICIGVNEAPKELWISDWLKQFRSEHPELTVELVTDTTAGLEARLLRGLGLDIVVCTKVVGPAECPNHALPAMELAFIGSSAHHPDRDYTLSELARFGFLSFQRGSRPARLLQDLLAEHQLNDVPINWMTSIQSIVDGIEGGLGVAILPVEVVRRRKSNSTLIELRTELEPSKLDFFLSVPRRGHDERVEAVRRSLLAFLRVSSP